jgi:TnpA family transposase
MPRREFLSPAQRQQVLALPSAERELIRFYSLSSSELAWIRKHRGAHNRLGFAVQLCFLKHPGRAWSAEEMLPEAMLCFVGRQIDSSPAALARYAERDQTRREHLAELQDKLGWPLFDGRAYRDLGHWLMALARSVDRGLALVEALMEELRRRRILAPRLTVLERLARETRRRARAELLKRQ